MHAPRRAVRVRAAWAALALGAIVAAGHVGAQTPGTPDSPSLGTRLVLPNGVSVLVVERPVLPIVTVRVAVAAGAVLDPPGKTGLANLTALLLVRGTARRTGPEIDRAIEFVGGSLEADGGRDGATLTLSVLRKDLELGWDLLAESLLAPAFPAEEFERQRAEVSASVRRADEDPGSVAGRVLRRLLFPGHPYGLPVPGTEASLAGLSREDVVAFHAAAYRPETTVVAAVGAVTPAEAQAALTARLGRWSAGQPAPGPPGAAPLGAPPGVETVQRDLTQATVLVGRAGVPRDHPDHYPLVVASHVLGGGSSSRLYQRVREERGLAYSIAADHAPGRHGGMFLVEFQSENVRVREGLALVRHEIERIRRERVPADELRRAKAFLVGSFPLRMSGNGAIAALLTAIEQHRLGLDYPARFRRGIDQVTPDDVLRVARAHWDPDAMSLVVVGDLREAGLANR
jgi:zinc protease